MVTRKANFRRSSPWTKGSLYEIGILFCKRFTKTRVPSNSPWKEAKWTKDSMRKERAPSNSPCTKGLLQEEMIEIGIEWPKGRNWNLEIWNLEIDWPEGRNWKFGIWKLEFGNWWMISAKTEPKRLTDTTNQWDTNHECSILKEYQYEYRVLKICQHRYWILKIYQFEYWILEI